MMDALEFVREKRRMCRTLVTCEGCCLDDCECTIGWHSVTEENDKRVIAAVEKWSKEHPKKTRQTEMLKLFPETRLDERGIIDDICPAAVGAICPKEGTCSACREKWWGEEIE